jgi:SAM-dependent methyltransferase
VTLTNLTSDTDRGYERFHLIASGPALFNAVVAGLELDIFAFLSSHPGATFADIHRHVAIPPHQLRVLLLALCATELVEKHDGRYANAPVADSMLAPDTPDSMRHVFLSRQRTDYAGLAYTTSALREGTNTGLAVHQGSADTLYGRLAEDLELQASLHASIRAFTLRTAPALIGSTELASVRHLLDVGGGSGTIAALFADRYPQARVTILDMPSVLTELARPLVPAAVADRVRVSPADMFADPFPHGIDGVLFCHVMEVFSPEQILVLLAKAYDVLPSGGKIIVYSFTAPGDEDGGVLAAQLSLYLNVLATGAGMAYPAREYESWLRGVGYADVASYRDLPFEHSLIVGRKA